MAGESTSTVRKPRRWKRGVAIGLTVVILLLLAALWQLPWLLGTAAGRAFIASRLSSDSARFSIDSLDLDWSGAQAVRGLRVTDAQNREVAIVSASFNGSLWALAQGSRNLGTVTLSGDVTVYESPSPGETGGDSKPAPQGKSKGLDDVVIPEGVKATLEVDRVSVTYVPLPGSTQPPMAMRDVKGTLAVDGRSPATLKLAGGTQVGITIGSFLLDASVADFADASGSLQPAQARFSASVKGENLPVPIIERMIGEQGRLSALLGDSMSLSVDATGGLAGGEARITATSPRSSTELQVTVDEKQRLDVTRGDVQLIANQQTLESLLSVDHRAGLSLTQQTTANLHINTFSAQLPTADLPLDLSKSSFDATLSIDVAALNTGREDVTDGEVRDLAVHVTSDDPTSEITIRSTAQITSRLAGQPQPLVAPLDADVSLLRAFRRDGSWSNDTLGLSGAVRSQNLPTSLIDSLAGANGWVVDAVGPMLARVELTAGSDATAGSATMLAMAASSSQFSVRADLRLMDGRVESIDDKPVEVMLAVSPGLRDRLAIMIAESAPTIRLEEGGRATVQLSSLNATLPTDSNPESWKAAVVHGSALWQDGRVTYAGAAAEGEAPGPPKRYEVESVSIDFRSESLSKVVVADVAAALTQDGIPLKANGKSEVANALDASTRTVTVEMEDTVVPLEIITAWSGDQAPVVTEALGGPVRLSLKALQFAAGLSANAIVRGERTDVQLTYALQSQQTLFELRGTQRATPGLVAALLGPAPVASLVEPADLTFTLGTSGRAAAGTPFNDWPLKLDASAPRAVISGLKGIPGAITTFNLKLIADWTAGLRRAAKYRLNGQLSDGKNVVATVESDLLHTLGGDWTESRGRITASDISVPGLERTFALEAGLLTSWLGAAGGLAVGSVIDSEGEFTDDLLVSASFDQANAHIAGRLDEDRLVINTPGTLSAHINRERLASFLNEWTGASATPSAATQWTVFEDSDLSATVRSVSLPLAALSGEEFDPQHLSIDADVGVPRMALRQGATDISLADTLLKVGGKSLAEGLTVQIKSAATTGAGAAPGGIDLNGSVRAATSRPEDRRYSVSGTMNGVPVAIVDAFAKMDGQLVAAIGPAMDMRLNVADAHAQGGTLSAQITSPNGTLSVPGAQLRDNTLVIESASPLTASLEVTPEMSATLLSDVNPLLYDVQKKAGPIAINAPNLVLPLDGDISKLAGRFTLDLGQVYVPTQGILGEFLGQLKPKTDEAQAGRVETLIPPITASITNGVLKYDKFVMQSQSFEISTSGKVDLVNRKLDLLASVPLIGWKTVFADMTNIAPSFLTDVPLNVPFYLVVRGPIDKPEIKPDPNGAQRVANEFFKNFGGSLIDNALKEILKPKKK